MTATESKIVDQYLTEIEAAAGSARTALVNELYLVQGIIEKRLSLSKTEVGVVAKVEADAHSVLENAEAGVESAVKAVESHL